MRTLNERRELRNKKIKQREKIMKYSGPRGGTLYETHVAKIGNSSGYMSKHGTLLHYATGTSHSHGKVRDRNSYSGTNNWKPSDIRQMNSMSDMEKEIINIGERKSGSFNFGFSQDIR